MNVVFLDRDGTLVVEPPDEQVDSLEKLEFIPGVIRGLRLLQNAGYSLVMVSNQDHLGTERYPYTKFEVVQGKILKFLSGEGITFDAIFICPHSQSDNCTCRKPKLGLIEDYLKHKSINFNNSYVVGDRETDVEFARNIGCKAIRLTSDTSTEADYRTTDFYDACRYIVRHQRTATVYRNTHETEITLTVSLDGNGNATINTGIGFFDHMLHQLVKHSGIDVILSVKGDLHVDEHHTVEDTGIVLGEAIRKALGDKRGLQRFGFAAPMDESLAHVSIDLSSRPHCTWNVKFKRVRVGELPTELIEDFFRAFADGLRATFHISATGRNEHHKIEAIFKSTALALKQAIARNLCDDSSIPSTKGLL
ncbi:MAG: bifunctional histidinol-phosphatase/imidazoleglycerol-phosphate dehydratase HisB [Bacteroidetes bacterium]|nr:bifunctional histidinol-phosphatase/imidazoleglycerol-phosphate dehydratase HisB [Bacteroidota bacterium]